MQQQQGAKKERKPRSQKDRQNPQNKEKNEKYKKNSHLIQKPNQGNNGGPKQLPNEFQVKRKQKNRDQFHGEIAVHQAQAFQFKYILDEVNFFNEHQIIEQLGNMDLIKAIEYVPIKFELLENIINFLKKFAQSRIGQVQQFARIILKSDLFKNLLYQICLTIYDQNSQIQIQQMVQLFKDLHSMFKICQSITDLRFSPIIIPIELIELVDQDYPKCELAKFFAEYHQLKEYLKTIRYSNDYIESPVEPIMLEFDFKSQIVGNLEKTNYLNYHYFILREDYLREFRQFIYKFKTKKKFEGTDRQFPLYQEAQLIDFNISNKDLIWTITLKQYDMDGRRRQIYDWKKSKRLTNGALLAFTNLQGYPIVFGVILDRDINQPNYKKKFEIQLSIKLLSNDILQFLDLFKTTNIVIENPIIYDVQTSYLQSLKTTKLPFNDIIVNGSKVVHFPNYIFNYNYTIYLSTTNDNNNNNNNNFNIQQFPLRTVPVVKNLNDQQWQQQGSLDQSQMNALKLMLSAEIALIQGPPGTGKTYCGALAVRNLLANVQVQALPLMVVCYTNHALDQFLNHILNYVNPQDVLRLGFGCKDPKIIPCMLTIQKTRIDFEWDKFKELKNIIENLVEKILNKNYPVSEEDIQNHWPKLYEQIIENVQHTGNDNQIITCWMNCIIPPGYNPNIQFYSSRSYLSQIKQIEESQYLPRTNQIELEQDDDESADEFLDSDEEAKSRFFREDYTPQIKQHKQKDNNLMKTMLNKRIPYDHKGIAELQNRQFNPWQLNKLDIRGILDYITHLMLLQDIQKYSSLVKQFEEMSSDLKLKYQQANYENFNSKKIIGVTITGAAKYTEILKQLNTKILVIEEAAEVLESHLISILTPNIQHLILIGDHQQLKPKLSCYELEQKYGANTSLFEKLFQQGLLNVTLTCQRRMKPKFADFIRLIYGNTYQDNIPYQQANQIVDGMNSDLIYFNHSWSEEKDANTTSTQNKKEANMIIELVIYLIGCKHKEESITILSLYLKQAMSIKKILVAKNLKNIKVQTVDNYQGEENEIVIISLVRSNNQGSIGYVKQENRINVALSRARVGLYVFGNFKCIQQSSLPTHLWSRIIALAVQKQVLKDSLELCCLRHRNVRQAKTPEQIKLLSPGCCDQICNSAYPNCTHKCPKKCHIGNHSALECNQQCVRFLACGHKCSAKCNQQCFLVSCQQKVRKVLPCQHEIIVECSKLNNNVICQEKVTKSYPCGHTTEYRCEDKAKYVRCQEKCQKQLSCGHPNNCRNVCSDQCDYCYVEVQITLSCGHIEGFYCYEVTNNSYLSFKCQQECNKSRVCGHPNNCQQLCYKTCNPCDVIMPKTLGCGHSHSFKCSQLKNGVPPFVLCKQPCIKNRVCGHTNPCINICSEICSPCQDICSKQRECGHQQPCTKICNHESECSRCENQCTKQRPCGHAFMCVNKCYQPCTQCEHPVNKLLPCGHTLRMMCYELVNPVICEQNCIKVRSCGHIYEPPCVHPCHKPCLPCNTMTSKQLICGHQVDIQCHKINQPFHEACMKTPCKKNLICGHPSYCTQPCSRPCDPCLQMAQKVLPCGHVIDVQCYRKTQYLKCPRPCPKTVCSSCNSPMTCNNLCGEPCQPCPKKMMKQFPCGHSQQTTCGEADSISCSKTIQKYKDCGKHYENVPCHKRLTAPTKCEEHNCLIF